MMATLMLSVAALLAVPARPAVAGDFSPDRFGIGAVLGQADSTKGVFVLRPIPNGPADRAGMLPGDSLLALDSLSVKGWPLDRVLGYLLSSKPSTVRVTIGRESLQLAVLVQRMRMADIAAGADMRYVLTPDSTGYQTVPLLELDPWLLGDTADGAQVTSPTCADLRLSLRAERPTFLYFWASWCGPCKRFISSLNQSPSLGASLQGVRVIGINLDAECRTLPTWLAQKRPSGEQYWGGGWHGELAQRFRIYRRGVPLGVALAKDGTVERIAVGADSMLALLNRQASGR
jgi:thiol-disulfide isomerase/thioredoxin